MEALSKSTQKTDCLVSTGLVTDERLDNFSHALRHHALAFFASAFFVVSALACAPDTPTGCNAGIACGGDTQCDQDTGLCVALNPVDLDGGVATDAACIDVDNDGFCSENDCNDDNPNLYREILLYLDNDNDNFTIGEGTLLCIGDELPTGFKPARSVEDDCNDADSSAYQNVTFYIDNDGDGSGVGDGVTNCNDGSIPIGTTTNVGPQDCDDEDPARFPQAVEACDLIDNNCNNRVDDNACEGCISGWLENDFTHPYQVCLNTSPQDFQGARNACRANAGYDLLILETEAESTLVREELINNDNRGWFIGLTDLAQEGNFVWVDGSPLTYTTAFRPNEPNNAGAIEHCVEIRVEGWNDIPCDNIAIQWVCEAIR